ncbi:MAG: hypothetical protein A2Y40_03720 [Candidatus Margulisbacteria bacterium GWF2_35_9]|nr:MAG: hypothetical protein A2Y40_03720 [Candidatus Margulisbacteria bacterium GWF2_35_9]
MPKSERELEKKVIEFNITRNHHRPLYGDYSYQSILGIDLVQECINQIEKKKTKIRILDIGCGDGFALNQLKIELEKKGYKNKFELIGIGINEYDPMYIPKSAFINCGFLKYEHGNNKPFDIIFSIYAFQYIWHKLEGIEKIHNGLLAPNGKAFVHFPGYLVIFSEKTSDIEQSEKEGNKKFLQFIDQWKLKHNVQQLSYNLNSFCYAEDDDDVIQTEFGILKLTKETNKDILFNAVLRGFSIFDEGFVFDSSIQGLAYIASYYDLTSTHPYLIPLFDPLESLYCIYTLKKYYQNERYRFHLAIHSSNNPVIIGIFPAAKEDLTGEAIPYLKMAQMLNDKKIGAVVRCNGLYSDYVDFHEYNDLFIHSFMDFIIENAKDICRHKDPEIYLIGYSSGGSVIASIASEYNQIKKILLIAPSYDSDQVQLTDNINNYSGELYVISAEEDEVVYPSQAAWFYFQAFKAKKKKFVKLQSCDHSFSGEINKEIIMKSPLWAFTDSNDFPQDETITEKEVYETYIQPEEGYK